MSVAESKTKALLDQGFAQTGVMLRKEDKACIVTDMGRVEWFQVNPWGQFQSAMAAPQQEAQEPTEIPEEIERMAADRYKVVPSHESMFHRWAVVAGTGTQQLYLGREVECQNMARKFAGAFLDGAFVAMQRTAPQPAPVCHHRPPCDECAAIAAKGGKA